MEATNGVVAVHCSGRITVGITCIRMDTYGSQLVNNVKLVIRFNEKCYDTAEFTDAEFAHKDLIIRDGFLPSEDVLEEFFRQVDATNSVVAVHCLGRFF